MSFAAFRNAIIQANLFGLDWFAESVTLRDRDGSTSTARVKIEQETRPAQKQGDKPAALRDVDGTERIRVVVCRDSEFEGAVSERPEIGSALTRDSAKDADVRPYVFAGECLAFCDTHATYIFERSRKQITTRG